MRPAPINVDAIIEELRTTGESKISLPQPVSAFCTAMFRITAALKPQTVLCAENPSDRTVMVLQIGKVSA